MLEKETNIIEIVKSRRYLSEAVRLLLSKEQRKKLKERSRYLIVNPDKLKGQVEKTNELDSSAASSDDSSHLPKGFELGKASENETNVL